MKKEDTERTIQSTEVENKTDMASFALDILYLEHLDQEIRKRLSDKETANLFDIYSTTVLRWLHKVLELTE